MAPKIAVPDAPSYLPADKKAQWSKTYAEEYEQSLIDNQDAKPLLHHEAALKQANRLLRSPKIESYEQAFKVEDHHIVKRAIEDNPQRENNPIKGKKRLKVVTSDGRKYVFPAPADAGKASGDDKKPKGNGDDKTSAA